MIDGATPSLLARPRRELSGHRKAYIMLALFMLGGVAVVPEIFPDATLAQGAFGGLMLGVWGALAAGAGKFFGD